MLDFLAANWVFIAFIGLMFVVHRSGMGCGMHGSHGDHQGRGGTAGDADEKAASLPVGEREEARR